MKPRSRQLQNKNKASRLIVIRCPELCDSILEHLVTGSNGAGALLQGKIRNIKSLQ